MEAPAETAPSTNAYQIFILVLTVLSLTIMALLLLPFDAAVHDLLGYYDNAICVTSCSTSASACGKRR